MPPVLNALIPLIYIGFSIAEALAPARPLPPERFARLRGLVFFLLSGAIMSNAPRLWIGWTKAHAPLHLAWLGAAGGAAVCFLAINLINYWWHRLRHRVDFLWLAFHQLHHASERLDVASAFAFHPLDVLSNAALTSVVAGLLGVSGDAAALAGLAGFTMAVFTHANLRTPRWLGYLVQRPESHSVHHGRGVHAFNYADLPVIDLLFGTFRNPALHEAKVGLVDGGARRMAAMLLGRRVS